MRSFSCWRPRRRLLPSPSFRPRSRPRPRRSGRCTTGRGPAACGRARCVVTTQETPARPPSDALVLFDGKDLSSWKSQKDGSPAAWKVENGYFEVVKGTGGIQTKQGFGDCQLHVEFMSPSPAVGEDQDRGNSGVFLMGMYEVQVLDSYKSVTYADGQASALYGQSPPLVNACRAPGQWQAYDIRVRGPALRRGGGSGPRG